MDAESRLDRLRVLLTAPVDAAGIAAFRVLFGLIATISAIRFLAYGWVDDFFVKPRFFFKYWGFEWVVVPPAPYVHALFVALAVLGVVVALGLFYRVAIVLLFVGFAYVQLMDKTNYLNHYVLVSLLTLTMSFMPLGRAYGLDGIRRGARLSHVPAYCLYLLRFQVGVVYFFAGMAKFESDWLLHAQPLDIWLSARTSLPIVGALFEYRFIAYVFSWAGFLFDTTIVAFLLWGRTRKYAYAVVLFFHAMTSLLFPIGMFPVIMVTAALIFFPPEWPRSVLRLPAVPAPAFRVPSRRVFAGWLAVGLTFAALQIAFPLRRHLYGGNVLWHEQGMRFSWRVMVREKNASITYYVEDPKTGRTWYVRPRDYLDARQEREFATQPDMILELAHAIARDHRARGFGDVRVRVEALVSLNGRRAAPLIDPNVDLTRIEDGVGKAPWILPAPASDPPHLSRLPRLQSG
jgi:hypothetical protein